MDDNDLQSLNRCLLSLSHLFIDIDRITPEKQYEEMRGGYGFVQVSTLDSGSPAAKLVATKTIRLYHVRKRPHRLTLRFARELKVWAGLQHAHILPLLGYYLDRDHEKAVLISDYMCNGDLKEYIEEKNPSWNVRVALARDISDGLLYLHTRSPPICHADLKLGNVLVNAQVRGILADFGLSTTLGEEKTGLTTSTGLKGTVRYYSPELILEPDGKHSLSSDIWAWGCLMLEAFTDTVPYAQKKTDPALWFALANKEPPAIPEFLAIPSAELKALLAKCWCIEPTERPSAQACFETMSKLQDLGRSTVATALRHALTIQIPTDRNFHLS